MKIGLLRVQLIIPCCSSLKAKRSIVKKYIARVRREFNVGVAEIGNHNQSFACCLGIVTIYRVNSSGESTLRRIITLFDQAHDIQLKDYLIEVL